MSSEHKLEAIISPSILSADFAHLADDCESVLRSGAEWLHVDVMDGHFVPNLTIGAPVVKALRRALPTAFLDCHLMVSEPEKWIRDFAQAGANLFTFHVEAVDDPSRVIDAIHAEGMRAGISLRPKTRVETILPFLKDLDFVLVMTVEPGFGGQSFMGDMMPKISTLRKASPILDIGVDGGLSLATVNRTTEVGANVIIAGTAIFTAKDRKEVIDGLRESVKCAMTSW